MRRLVSWAVLVLVAACRTNERAPIEPPAPPTSPALAVASSDVAPASPTPSSPGVPAWPSGVKSVLHVGDSTLGYTLGLALELRTRFLAAGIHYEAHTETSAGLHSFAASKKLEELVREKKPDVVLISLGINNLTVPHPDEYERDVRSIVRQAGKSPCWWVGPLALDRPEKGLNAMLARTTAPCRFASSYDLRIERQPDGIHPTQRGAHRWADVIWTTLMGGR
jgi:lysophospholipase L1-like esterase